MFKKTVIFLIIVVLIFSANFTQFSRAEYFNPYYIPGNLFKHPGGTTIYFAADGELVLHPFFNEDVFNSWGYSFDLVKTDQYLFNYYTVGSYVEFRDGSLVKRAGSSTIYFASQGRLRPIFNWQTLEKFGWQNRKIYIISDVEFFLYKIGSTITENSPRPAGDIVNYQGTYYYIYDNAKAQITDYWWPTYRYDKSQAASFYYGENLYYSLPELNLDYKPTAADPLVPKGIPTKSSLPNISCDETDYKMAFIFLYQGSLNYTQQTRVNNVRSAFDDNFAYATDYLAEMDTDRVLVTMSDSSDYYYYNNDGSKTMDFKKVMKKFYESNTDDYDFVTIFTDFDYFGLYRHYQPVQSNVLGTGFIHQDTDYIYYNNSDYGSQGRLKGVILMGYEGITSLLDQDSVENETDNTRELSNYLLEQLGHRWLAYVDFYDYQTGVFSDKLRSPSLNDGLTNHWSPMVIFDSPIRTSAYDLSDYNNQGVIVEEFPVRKLKYSMLDLYLMGLKPLSAVNYVKYIDPAITNTPSSSRVPATIKTVNTEQLQKAIGRRECLL